MPTLSGKTIAILAANGVEQVELTSPRQALQDAGATTHIIGLEDGIIRGWNHVNWGDDLIVDRAVNDADANEYDALFLPGGVMNPDHVRNDARAVAFVRQFVQARKPIGALCHGGQTLISARGVRGHRLTSYPSLRVDFENAGADWVDEEVVVHDGLVTSRTPADLPAFNDAMVQLFAEPATVPHVTPDMRQAAFRREGRDDHRSH